MSPNVLSMKSPDLIVSGVALKRARELAGHTQEAFARLVGVARTTVACWESSDSKRQPTATNFEAICRALGVKPETLLMVPDDRAA